MPTMMESILFECPLCGYATTDSEKADEHARSCPNDSQTESCPTCAHLLTLTPGEDLGIINMAITACDKLQLYWSGNTALRTQCILHAKKKEG